MLLHHACAEHVGDERHRDAVLVVGEADHEVRVALAKGRDHAQLELLRGGRVDGGALEQADLGVDGVIASTARSMSSMVAPPVDTIIGLPIEAT